MTLLEKKHLLLSLKILMKLDKELRRTIIYYKFCFFCTKNTGHLYLRKIVPIILYQRLYPMRDERDVTIFLTNELTLFQNNASLLVQKLLRHAILSYGRV